MKKIYKIFRICHIKHVIFFTVLHPRYLENQCRKAEVVISSEPIALATQCIAVKIEKNHVDIIYI